MTAFMPLAMEKDLRCDLMATGSGSLSMRWTGVHETMALQHRSCRLKTAEGGKQTQIRDESVFLPAALQLSEGSDHNRKQTEVTFTFSLP